jgi:hypothetical protein
MTTTSTFRTNFGVLARAVRCVLAVTATLVIGACSDPGASYVQVNDGAGGIAVRVADVEWIEGPSGTYIAMTPGAVDAYCEAIQSITTMVRSELAAGNNRSFLVIEANSGLMGGRTAFSEAALGVVGDPADAELVQAFVGGDAADRPAPCNGPIDEWGADLFDGTSSESLWRMFHSSWATF